MFVFFWERGGGRGKSPLDLGLGFSRPGFGRDVRFFGRTKGEEGGGVGEEGLIKGEGGWGEGADDGIRRCKGKI